MQVYHKATQETTVSIRLYLREQFSTWLSFHKPNASRLQNGRNFFFHGLTGRRVSERWAWWGGERQTWAADGKGGEKYNHNKNKQILKIKVMILFSPPFRRASCASWSPTSDSPEKQKRQKISPVLQAKALKQYVLTNRQRSERTKTNNNKESLSVDAQSCTAESRKPGRYAAQISSEWPVVTLLLSGFC